MFPKSLSVVLVLALSAIIGYPSHASSPSTPLQSVDYASSGRSDCDAALSTSNAQTCLLSLQAVVSGGSPPVHVRWILSNGTGLEGQHIGLAISHGALVYGVCLTAVDSTGASVIGGHWEFGIQYWSDRYHTQRYSPVATSIANISPPCSTVGQPVNFSGQVWCSTDCAPPPIVPTWSFGDGSSADGVNATYSYSQQGTYFAKFIGTDSYGRTNYLPLSTYPVIVVHPLANQDNRDPSSPVGLDGVGTQIDCMGQPYRSIGCVARSLTTSSPDDAIILMLECGITECNTNVSSIYDSSGLSFTLRGTYTPNVRLWEFYAIAPSPLSSDNITVVFSGGSYASLFALGVKGVDPTGLFDPNSPTPATATCADTTGQGVQYSGSCSISVGTSGLAFVIANIGINDAGPCVRPSSFTTLEATGSQEVDFQIVSAPQQGSVFTCSGTDAMAMMGDALVLSGVESRPPIQIDGNGGFTVDNGITGGTGTSMDPYLIQGWDIDSTMSNGIDIRNTDAYFTIEDVYVHSDAGPSNFSYAGIFLDNVSNGQILENGVSRFQVGVIADFSSNSLVVGNFLWNNVQTILVQASNNLDISSNEFSYNIGPAVAQVQVLNSNGVDVSSNSFRDDRSAAIFYGRSFNFNIVGNQLVQDQAGISVDQSQSFLVEQNSVQSSGDDITVTTSSALSILANTIVYGNGIRVAGSSQLEVSNNDVRWSGVGLSLDHVSLATVSSNYLFGNSRGAVVSSSQNITFLGNAFIDNLGWGGLFLYSDSGVLIFHNNFVNDYPAQNDTPLAYDDQGSLNSWDNGYPDGGNHWSYYSGIDNCSGPNQDVCPNSDGIGDTPYTFSFNQDNYPSMRPF